ncbi:protein jag [Janibacter sp. YAF2_2]|uniref:Jag family protein n=1 Tax=Janibacter sp. YAF2_2 TaxID=3233079 RepID=UPI003F9380D3
MSETPMTEVAAEPETTETPTPETAAPKRSRRELLEREGEVAADFLETLLDIADLDGDIDLDIDGDRAAVAVVDSDEGRVPRRLVGQDGKVLEALQELTRLAVQSATGDRSRLMLDVAGHRAARRAELVELAQQAIDTVKSSGESVDLEPMSAFERKVVHDEVLAAGLVSDSSGTEPRRYVVVYPAEAAAGDQSTDASTSDSADSSVSAVRAPRPLSPSSRTRV